MRQLVRRPPLLLLAVLLLASPLAAETYTVELTNGTSFVSRHQPQEASWDSSMVLLMTEHGNWIALPRADVAKVISTTEVGGFGRLINTTTIDLGWAPNDSPLPEEEASPTPLDLLQSLLQQEQPSYDQRQFVSPSEVGGGLPVGFATGLGGGGAGLVPFPIGGAAPSIPSIPPANGGSPR